MSVTAGNDLASLHDSAQRFAAQLVRSEGASESGNVRNHVDRDGWREISALGWPGLLLPPEHGGFGLPLRYLATVAAVFARHGTSHPLTIVGAEVPALLLGAGSSQQVATWLGALAERGDLIVSALWDAGHPYETSCVTASWRAEGDGYVLDGVKSPVPYAMLADAFVVLAREQGSGDLQLFVVPTGTSGAEVVPLPTTTEGPTGELRLTGVRVAAEARLEGGDVALAVEHAIRVGAAIASAELTVAALRGLELTIEYVKVRKQFDKALGEFQAVHHHCADMYRDVEAMRIVSGSLLEGGLMDEIPSVAVAIAKAQTSAKGRRVLELAHQLHGGVAFYVDYPLELIYRRSLVLQGEYGSSRWHRTRLGHELKTNHQAIQRQAHAL